jgi:uncharacterized protein (UPF0332 family)
VGDERQVSDASGLWLGRGREELRAARVLLDSGFPSQALSRAYLAGFHAASAALTFLDDAPATRTGVLSAFARRVIGEEELDHSTGRILRRLFEDRNDVDYALAAAPPDTARTAVDDAERLLEATARWLDRRSSRS